MHLRLWPLPGDIGNNGAPGDLTGEGRGSLAVQRGAQFRMQTIRADDKRCPAMITVLQNDGRARAGDHVIHLLQQTGLNALRLCRRVKNVDQVSTMDKEIPLIRWQAGQVQPRHLSPVAVIAQRHRPPPDRARGQVLAQAQRLDHAQSIGADL